MLMSILDIDWPVHVDQDTFEYYYDLSEPRNKIFSNFKGNILVFCYQRAELMTGSGPTAIYEEEGYYVYLERILRPKFITRSDFLDDSVEGFILRCI